MDSSVMDQRFLLWNIVTHMLRGVCVRVINICVCFAGDVVGLAADCLFPFHAALLRSRGRSTGLPRGGHSRSEGMAEYHSFSQISQKTTIVLCCVHTKRKCNASPQTLKNNVLRTPVSGQFA